jgi:transposase
MKRYTINDFNNQFPDEQSCLEHIKNARWPDGIFCHKCQKVTQHYRIRTKKVYSCDMCGSQVSPTADTIFHKSRTPLRSWFYAMYLMASTRTGVSAKHLERELGVTYKTAWRMFDQIRKLMAEDVDPLSGQVEADETYVGGRRKGKRGRGAAGKTIVQGMVERKGKIIAEVVPDVKAKTLMPNIIKKVIPASTVFTDELKSYSGLGTAGFTHESVNHGAEVWVSGTAHTNTIEGLLEPCQARYRRRKPHGQQKASARLYGLLHVPMESQRR